MTCVIVAYKQTEWYMFQDAVIVGRFDVGFMGRMRCSTKRSLLVLISDPFNGLYKDRWESDILHYIGIDPKGHQDMNCAQNRALAESPASKIPLYLLEALDLQKYTVAILVAVDDKSYREIQ